MSYYRPTLEDIRACYEGDDNLISARPWDENEDEAMERLGEQFDSWMADVLSKAYRLALQHVYEDGHLTETQRDKYGREQNPYGGA